MVVRFVLWNLADTATSVEELRAEPVRHTAGAVAETWFSDSATERWGAFTVFEGADAAAAPVDARLRELIGKPPDVVELFTLEPTA
jgi:hypothetical protein